MNDVTKRVSLIITQCLQPNKAVTASSDLRNDLGADSLDAVEIIMATETEFNIKISDAEAEKMHTVGDLIKLVGEKNS